MTDTFIHADETAVFPRELDRAYPLIVRAKGVWLEDAAGNRILDAISGGAFVTSLGFGVEEIIAAADRQQQEIAFAYTQQFTTPPHEHLARELTALAPDGFTRVHFVSGGAEANECLLRLARAYHAERGEAERWRVITPAQSYHGPTMATLSLSGRASLQAPNQPYIVPQPHIPPSTWRLDPTGKEALAALDAIIEEHGPETIAAFFCEPVSAAALPAYSPPKAFWQGLEERRREYGFLICFDEVVTGLGRTGSWFAAEQLPVEADIIATAKGLGAGYAPVGAMICRDRVYEAIASGSRAFEHGHTWDGAPLPCAVGSAVIDYLKAHNLVEHVRERGPKLREQLEDALRDCEMVREVRGRGFLLGIDYVDPRDGESLLDPALKVASRIDIDALEHGLTLYSTAPTSDGYAGDQTALAPAFVATEEELGMIVERTAEAIRTVEQQVKSEMTVKTGAAQ